MRLLFALAAFTAVFIGSKALSADYMQEVRREPATAVGSAQEITKRALRCIATTTQMEPNPFVDLESGLVVATATAKGRSFIGGQQQVIRTKLTVEAKDSKFRITQSEIMVSYITSTVTAKYEFRPVESKSKASKDVSEALAASYAKLASCIASPPDDF